MNRVCAVALVFVFGACAASPLRDARQMGLAREGGLKETQVELIDLVVEVHEDAPLTLPQQPALEVPALPAVDRPALDAVAVQTLQLLGTALGVSVSATATTTEAGGLPARLETLLEADIPAAMSLTVHVGWCPVGEQWAACVRSPDSALGYGPPGVQGFIYSRFRAKHSVAIARRVGFVGKDYVYEIDESTAHLDRPFVGTGETFQAQAEDAVRQAVGAWLTVARGRRGQRIVNAAMVD